MTPPRVLTAKQQEWIAHLEQAQQQKLALREYARRAGIKAATLYAARKWLNEKASRGLPCPSALRRPRWWEMARLNPASCIWRPAFVCR